jgi:hypothetical protein
MRKNKIGYGRLALNLHHLRPDNPQQLHPESVEPKSYSTGLAKNGPESFPLLTT